MSLINRKNLEDYIAGTTAAWAAYTVPFAALEFYEGYSTKEVLIARGIGLGAHMIAGPVIQKTREGLAKKLNVYDDQKIRKFLVNEASVLLVQPPVYLGILGLTAFACYQPFQEFADAAQEVIPKGLGIALLMAPFFGKFVDGFWKKHIFKTNPTFEQRNTLEEETLRFQRDL